MSGVRCARGMLAAALAFGALAGWSVSTSAATGAVQFGTPQNDEVFGISVDGAGNTYAVGSTAGSLLGPSQGGDDAYIIKRSSAGAILWARQFGTTQDDTAYGVAAQPDGTVYVAGVTQFPNPSNDSYGWIGKFSADGTPQWRRQIGRTGASRANGVVVDDDGNAVVVGYTPGPGGDLTAFAIKYNPSGTPIWQKAIGASGSAAATSIAIGAGGQIHVAGYIGSAGISFDDDDASKDAFLLTYAAVDGAVLWQRRPSTSAYDVAFGVAADASGNVYLAGDTYGSLAGANAGDRDVFLIKYDENGTIVWGRQFGSPEYDDVWAVSADGAGNTYIVGETTGSPFAANAGDADGWVASFSAAGAPLWARQIGTAGYDAVEAVTVSGGTVCVAGTTEGSLFATNLGDGDAFFAAALTQ